MPQTQSAKKALRQNTRRRKLNNSRKSKIRSVIKNYKKLVEGGKTDEAKEYLKTVYKTIDKMGKVKLIKKGRVKRLKSRLSKRIKK